MAEVERAAASGTYSLGCRACRAATLVRGDAQTFDCTSCGRRNFAVSCARCGGADVVAGSGTRPPSSWTCAWCLLYVSNIGIERLRRRKNATAVDVWRSLERHGLTSGDRDVRVLGGFQVVGGSGSCPPPGTACSLATLADGVLVVCELRARGRTLIPYAELLELEVGGHGTITTDAGIIGGGRGIRGAVTGIAVASMINNATRKTSVDSFLRLTARGTELLLSHWRYPPQNVRRDLSRMFVAHLAAARTAAAPPPVVIEAPRPAQITPGPVDELERLTKLHAAGTLTDTEFEAARARQIKRLHAGDDQRR